MDYTNAISMALDCAKVRFDYYKQDPKLRYLQEASDWVEVAKIYIRQELNLNSAFLCEDHLNEAA